MKKRRGFTLVELLVVITIIGILVALLLPAVQRARESSMRNTCSDNLKNLTLGCNQHETAHGYFPTGGWSGAWSGDPDRPTNQGQPGGWTYNVLPFVDGSTYHDLGMGLIGTGSISNKKPYLAQAAQNPMAIFYCPSRRSPLVYPLASSANTCNSAQVAAAARSDYAANAGTYYNPATGQGTNYAGTSYNAFWTSVSTSGDPSFAGPGYLYPDMSAADGVIFTVSMVTMSDIRDGASNTMMMSEKYIDPLHYTDGMDLGDSGPIFSGSAPDWQRWASNGPVQDKRGFTNVASFGSCHVDGLNVATCDNSVHWTNYNIDVPTFKLLCCRNDMQSLQATQLGW
jgi:prepilin-type N-terminal cleavage/methylation domain-containing protein